MSRRTGPTCARPACAAEAATLSDPGDATVDLLLAAVDPAGEPLPARFWRDLSDEERARAERFRHARDRAQFVAARGLLRAALRRRFGATEVRIVAPTGAKPTVVGVNIPAALDFNLSHTDGLVACALAVGAAVGVDVERRDRDVDALGIAAAQFAPAEIAAVHDAASFLRVWTLKEAVAKAAGLGLALPLADFTCADAPPRLVDAGATLGRTYGRLAWWRLDCWTQAAHVAALAVYGAPPRPVRLQRVILAAL